MQFSYPEPALETVGALAAAFGVWLNVANEPELATIVSVPVEYNHFPKDLEISSDIVETIDLEARGPPDNCEACTISANRGELSRLILQALMHPANCTFTLTTSGIEALRAARIDHLIRTIPAQLRFKFEK